MQCHYFHWYFSPAKASSSKITARITNEVKSAASGEESSVIVINVCWCVSIYASYKLKKLIVYLFVINYIVRLTVIPIYYDCHHILNILICSPLFTIIVDWKYLKGSYIYGIIHVIGMSRNFFHYSNYILSIKWLLFRVLIAVAYRSWLYKVFFWIKIMYEADDNVYSAKPLI